MGKRGFSKDNQQLLGTLWVHDIGSALANTLHPSDVLFPELQDVMEEITDCISNFIIAGRVKQATNIQSFLNPAEEVVENEPISEIMDHIIERANGQEIEAEDSEEEMEEVDKISHEAALLYIHKIQLYESQQGHLAQSEFEQFLIRYAKCVQSCDRASRTYQTSLDKWFAQNEGEL